MGGRMAPSGLQAPSSVLSLLLLNLRNTTRITGVLSHFNGGGHRDSKRIHDMPQIISREYSTHLFIEHLLYAGGTTR